jgi:hypothetical protein
MSASDTTRHAIFLSHASEDRTLALRLQALLEACIRWIPNARLVFSTSDITAIEGGQDWYKAIVEAVRGSRACLALLTPNSIYSKPWVSYESGAAYATAFSGSDPKRVFGLLANGVTQRIVPAPLQPFQTRDLAQANQVAQLLKELAGFLGAECMIDEDILEGVVQLCSGHGQRWDSVEPVLVARSSDESPFNFEIALGCARQHVALFGQNLQRVARTESLQRAIIDFLKRGPERRVDLVICDVRNSKAVDAWSTLNPDLELTFPYRDQLEQSTTKFKELVETCRREHVATLAVKAHDLVPFGATAVDPITDDGVIGVHPMINHVAKAAERPQFLIRRRTNRDVFQHYWRALQWMLEYGYVIDEAAG